MARPRTGNRVTDVTLTLGIKNLSLSKKLAFQRGISLSDLVDRLLVAELSSKASIAMRHGRTLEAAK